MRVIVLTQMEDEVTVSPVYPQELGAVEVLQVLHKAQANVLKMMHEQAILAALGKELEQAQEAARKEASDGSNEVKPGA